MKAERATINDVARQAGVSIKTVSRVLNHEPKVRGSTRDKVHAAMKALNYRPNSSARRLAGNRTYLLGLIYNANSSYITSIQNGVLEACRGQHYDLLIHPCRYTDPNLLDEISELVSAPRVDGLILIPPVSDSPEVRALVDRLDVPHVTISREALDDSAWSVGTDDRRVSQDLVMHLARHGHQRIAFIQGHPDHKAMANRHAGYLDGMRQAGLRVRKSLVAAGQNSYESGVDETWRLLRLKSPPTAIICANDHMAAGAMKVAHEMGLAIPGDLSITGFDDIPLASQIWPPLTTVRQPLHAMAKMAAKLLIQRLRGETPDSGDRTVPSELMVRESTGPAPNGR